MKKQAETESVPWRDRPGHLSSSLRKTGRWWSGSGGEWLKLEQITPPRLHTMTVGSLDPYTHSARKKENQNTNLDRRACTGRRRRRRKVRLPGIPNSSWKMSNMVILSSGI